MRALSRIVLVALAVTLAACASTSSKSSSGPNTTANGPTTTVARTPGVGPGVTDKEIRLGVVLIDYKCIPDQFIDEERPDEQKAYQAFVDDINQHGGINGRQIKTYFKVVCPVQGDQAGAACTALTDDDNVFAVIGSFGDLSGNADLCVTKQHKRILLTYDLNQELIDKAPPAQLLTPDILPDRKIRVLMSLLKSQHTLDGKTVAVLGDASASDRISKQIEPALKQMNVQRGSTGIITVTDADTTAAQAQLDGFIENWKTQHVNAIVLSGDAVETRPFIDKVKKELPEVQLVSDSTAPLEGGQAEVKAGVTPNAFAGIITAEGRTGLEHTKTPHFTQCKTIFEAQTHMTVPSPNAVIKLPDGRKNNIYGEEEDACNFVEMFKTIAERVGPDLNNTNWRTVVDNFGPIDIQSTDFASLRAGKYDADNTYGLVQFDPTIPQTGDWKRMTDVMNVDGQ